MAELLDPIIDVICLFEILEEDTEIYYTSDSDVDTRGVEKRIQDAKKLKEKYFNILN